MRSIAELKKKLAIATAQGKDHRRSAMIRAMRTRLREQVNAKTDGKVERTKPQKFGDEGSAVRSTLCPAAPQNKYCPKHFRVVQTGKAKTTAPRNRGSNNIRMSERSRMPLLPRPVVLVTIQWVP